MFTLLRKPTHKQPICNNFNGTVKNIKKGKHLALKGKCATCKGEFADHSCVKNACPLCGKHQPSQCGSIKGLFGKKYAVIKFNACDCAVSKRLSFIDPMYVDLKPISCKCGKIVSYSENPAKKQAFCGDVNCFMKNYKIPQKNVDLNMNGVKLPPLNLTLLSQTKFCACGNVCEYDLEQNAYKDECRHCNMVKSASYN